MEKSKIHAQGEKDFLKSLREKYDALRKQVGLDPSLSKKEKEEAIKELQESHRIDRRDSRANLY
ncbi:MAG: hypothetical protein AAGA86_14180 [Bacteroidota bacterium]